MALLHAVASITLKGNQIISGVAINFLAQGLTAVLGLALVSTRWRQDTATVARRAGRFTADPTGPAPTRSIRRPDHRAGSTPC